MWRDISCVCKLLWTLFHALSYLPAPMNWIDIEKRPRRKHGFPSAIPRLAASKIQDRISSPTAKLVRIGKNQPNLSIEQTQGRCNVIQSYWFRWSIYLIYLLVQIIQCIQSTELCLFLRKTHSPRGTRATRTASARGLQLRPLGSGREVREVPAMVPRGTDGSMGRWVGLPRSYSTQEPFISFYDILEIMVYFRGIIPFYGLTIQVSELL